MLQLEELNRQRNEETRKFEQSRNIKQKQLLKSMANTLSMVRYSKTQQEQRLGVMSLGKQQIMQMMKYMNDTEKTENIKSLS